MPKVTSEMESLGPTRRTISVSKCTVPRPSGRATVTVSPLLAAHTALLKGLLKMTCEADNNHHQAGKAKNACEVQAG